jgi:hypothetical protein
MQRGFVKGIAGRGQLLPEKQLLAWALLNEA